MIDPAHSNFVSCTVPSTVFQGGSREGDTLERLIKELSLNLDFC